MVVEETTSIEYTEEALIALLKDFLSTATTLAKLSKVLFEMTEKAKEEADSDVEKWQLLLDISDTKENICLSDSYTDYSLNKLDKLITELEEMRP
jgi:hypothetical protein